MASDNVSMYSRGCNASDQLSYQIMFIAAPNVDQLYVLSARRCYEYSSCILRLN